VVDAHPRLKQRLGEWYYAATALRTFNRHYLLHPPRVEAALGDDRVTGVTVIVENAPTYTYFGERPVELGEGTTLESGDLSGVVLRRASPIDVPTLLWRALAKRPHFIRHRQVHPFAGLERLRVSSLDDRPLPLQVDGDYIGEVETAQFAVIPDGLLVLS
jgi:diacylglycerol kinase family enzyme